MVQLRCRLCGFHVNVPKYYKKINKHNNKLFLCGTCYNQFVLKLPNHIIYNDIYTTNNKIKDEELNIDSEDFKRALFL